MSIWNSFFFNSRLETLLNKDKQNVFSHSLRANHLRPLVEQRKQKQKKQNKKRTKKTKKKKQKQKQKEERKICVREKNPDDFPSAFFHNIDI